MVDLYTNPWYLLLLVWIFLGMITVPVMSKTKAPWLLEVIVAVLVIMSWPILLIIASRR